MSDNNRRDFLKKLSTGVGGIALAGSHRFVEHSGPYGAQEVGASAERTVLSSQDGGLAITFQIVASDNQPAPGGRLVYAVSFQGKPLITASGPGSN